MSLEYNENYGVHLRFCVPFLTISSGIVTSITQRVAHTALRQNQCVA